MFNKKNVPKYFAKLIGKPLFFFNNVAGLRPPTLFFRKPLTQLFSCQFYEILEKTFFTEHFGATAFE